MCVVFELLAEGVSQTSELTHRHILIVKLALSTITGTDLLRIGVAGAALFVRANALLSSGTRLL